MIDFLEMKKHNKKLRSLRKELRANRNKTYGESSALTLVNMTLREIPYICIMNNSYHSFIEGRNDVFKVAHFVQKGFSGDNLAEKCLTAYTYSNLALGIVSMDFFKYRLSINETASIFASNMISRALDNAQLLIEQGSFNMHPNLRE